MDEAGFQRGFPMGDGLGAGWPGACLSARLCGTNIRLFVHLQSATMPGAVHPM